MTTSIAVIGAGFAGLSCASRLTELGHTVHVFEKSRGASGRVSTRALAEGHCDHGAQYITALHPDFQKVVRQWESDGLLRTWQPRLAVIGPKAPSNEGEQTSPAVRYVGTPKMTSPAQAMAKTLDVFPNTRITKIERSAPGWRLIDEHGRNAMDATHVVFAIPPAQIVPILNDETPQWATTAKTAIMLPCWTLMAFVSDTDTPDFDAAFINEGPLSWIANNASKPGRNALPIWTIHATAEWSTAHINATAEQAAPALIAEFERITGLQVTSFTPHRWLYARAECPTDDHYLWDDTLKIGAAGDWLLQGNVEGAWLSGQRCAETIHRYAR